MKGIAAAAGGVVLITVLGLCMLVAVLFGSDEQAQAAAPGGQPGVVCTTAPTGADGPADGQEIAGFSGEQLDNAAAIVAQGKALGVPERGWVVAVATAR